MRLAIYPLIGFGLALNGLLLLAAASTLFWPLSPGTPTVARTGELPPEARAAFPVPPLEEILTRPLFHPQRRPARSRPVAAPQAAPTPTVAAPAFNYEIAGFITTAAGVRRVYLSDSASGQTLSAEVGETINGWEIVRIGQAEITVARDGRETQIKAQ